MNINSCILSALFFISFALVCGYSQERESVQQKKITELVNAIKSDQGNKALQALGNIGSEKAVKPLVKLLKDNNIQKRLAAAWALEKIPSPKAIKALRKALNNEDEEVRMWAKFTFENTKTK